MKNSSKNHFPKFLLLAATICMGYVASLFLTYSFIVMPGLSIIDDRSFVAAFQGLESRFAFESSGYANFPAMIAFPGSIILTALAVWFFRKEKSVKLIAAAWIIFIIGMIPTFYVNLPSNEYIYTAGSVNEIDVAKVRQEFNEVAWTQWNHFRAFTTSVSTLLLIRAKQFLM